MTGKNKEEKGRKWEETRAGQGYERRRVNMGGNRKRNEDVRNRGNKGKLGRREE